MSIKKQKYNRVTYEELSKDLSHYEISFLSSLKAIDIIKSGVSLIGNNPYKPKVALVALNELCSNLESALDYKKEIKDRMFNVVEHEEVDEYNIDFASDQSLENEFTDSDEDIN